MSELAQLHHMSVPEFLDWQEQQENRYELVDGVPVAMAGARQRHDRVVVNAVAELRNQLRGKPCRPFTGDTAVLIPAGNIRRPDAGVDCAPPDDAARTAGQPRLVIEVLSPSTRALDVMRKLDEYKSVPSIDHILLVDPDVLDVIVWSREGDTWDRQTLTEAEASITLPGMELTLRLADLYDGLRFPARPTILVRGPEEP